MKHDQSQFAAATAYREDVSGRVKRFLPMVRNLAWHLSGSCGAALDVEDLMQAGLVALTECAQKHDGPGEDGFAAYAKLRVRGAMVDLLRSTSPEPRGARTRRRQLEQERSRLANILGREPTMRELAEAMGLASNELAKAQAESAAVQVTSLEDAYHESDSAFAADEPDAETVLLQQEDREMLIEAIESLSERHKLVIQLYFVEELNLAEIAAVLSVSVPRVHQLKAAALQSLKLTVAG